MNYIAINLASIAPHQRGGNPVQAKWFKLDLVLNNTDNAKLRRPWNQLTVAHQRKRIDDKT